MSSDSARRMARLRALRQVFADDQHEQPLPSVKSDINVTPLVDVVLVLLIIFMVVTPMIASGVAVDLPKTAHHLRKPDDGKDIIVSVTQDKRYYVGTTRVNRVEDLSAAIKNERRRFPEKTIFVKGDARAPFGTVREAMQVLQASEISDGTEELQKIGGGS
jgi:biopolymer transport protein TolR